MLKKNISFDKTYKMDIQKAKEHDLFLTTELGHGKYGDEEISISLSANNSFLLFEFKDSRYIVNTQSIVEDVIKFREQEKR